jgi:hypothetical protein
MMTNIKTRLLYAFCDLATCTGLRRLGGGWLTTWFPGCYEVSPFFVENGEDFATNDDQTKFCISLTIDDGLCRPAVGENPTENDNSSMVEDVRQLLDAYRQAEATFFVCTEYTYVNDASIILSHGHELGNHLRRDVLN